MGSLSVALSARLTAYQASDVDTAADTKYYGNLAVDGSWYIMEEVTTAGTFRFVRGSSDYATAWTNRAAQTYVLFNLAF